MMMNKNTLFSSINNKVLSVKDKYVEKVLFKFSYGVMYSYNKKNENWVFFLVVQFIRMKWISKAVFCCILGKIIIEIFDFFRVNGPKYGIKIFSKNNLNDFVVLFDDFEDQLEIHTNTSLIIVKSNMGF